MGRRRETAGQAISAGDSEETQKNEEALARPRGILPIIMILSLFHYIYHTSVTNLFLYLDAQALFMM